MLKGLTEARRQLIMSYPSKEDVTEAEWTSELQHWAETAYEKLVALGPLSERRALSKPPPEGVKSLTEAEMNMVIATIVRCTDLKQLKKLQDAFYIHMRPLVDRFKRYRR